MKIMRRLIRLVGTYLAVQQVIALLYLATRDARNTLEIAPERGFPGTSPSKTVRYKNYTVTHSIENGIERISYRPHEPKHETPIVMQHGMWHGAWCWERWQRILAEQGWESHAHSLPGHALSPTQRPIRFCTLDYYLSFLKREMERHERTPILMGHSMGGALTQWYLKYVSDSLPAAVLVAPWASHISPEYFWDLINLDPVGIALLPPLTLTATSWVRSPKWAAQKLISDHADMTPEELYAHLGPESVLVLLQHAIPAFWTPPENVRTPMLLLAAELDTVCPEKYLRMTAQFYGADYRVVPDAAHNLMMDGDFTDTAMQIHAWLEKRKIV